MIEVMRVVDHVLEWLFDHVYFSPNHPWFSCIHTRVVGRENIIVEEVLFRAVFRHYVSHDIDAITGTLQLNDIADSLCCMYLIDRFSQFLRCEVALHFKNTWDINDF